MNPYSVVSPEVTGRPTPDAMDRSVWPPEFSNLTFRFEGWLGDDLVEGFPVFLVTDNLKQHLDSAQIPRLWCEPVKIVVSEDYSDREPGVELPTWHWLRSNGRPWVDPVWMDIDCRLVVRDDALEVFRSARIGRALIRPAVGLAAEELAPGRKLKPGVRSRELPR